jgi:glutathione S-transferase
MKAEAYLRLCEIPYRSGGTGSPQGAPKKKLPFIDDDGTRVADSSHIIEYLKKKFGDKLDAKLSDEQRAVAHAVRKMMEESLYFSLVWSRWVDDLGWPHSRKLLESAMPPVVRTLVPPLVRGSIRKANYAQGMGRHSRDEIYELGKGDLTALSRILGDKPFLMGDEPTSVDCSAVGMLAQILLTPVVTPLTEHARSLGNLEPYTARMMERAFPDFVSKSG